MLKNDGMGGAVVPVSPGPSTSDSAIHLVWPRRAPKAASGTAPPVHWNRLLQQQLRAAAVGSADGAPDYERLLDLISRHYDLVDDERRGIVRSMQLMSDEAQALTREIREQTASQLQAILDHIKDAVITVDDAGHIETFNPTGERIFGYDQQDVLGRSFDHLIPEATREGSCISGALGGAAG
jgi:PAS domain-containing protein